MAGAAVVSGLFHFQNRYQALYRADFIFPKCQIFTNLNKCVIAYAILKKIWEDLDV